MEQFGEAKQQKWYKKRRPETPTEWMLFSALVITIIFFVCQVGYFIMGPCAKTDIMIMLDESMSLSEDGYQRTKHFASNLANLVTSDTTHVGVAKFANKVRPITNGYLDNSTDIKKALDKSFQERPNNETRILKSLNWVIQEVEGETARKSAKKIQGVGEFL